MGLCKPAIAAKRMLGLQALSRGGGGLRSRDGRRRWPEACLGCGHWYG